MAKEAAWTQRLVPLWRRSFAALLLVTGLAVTVVQGQQPPRPGDPCWFGNFAACQAGCMQFFNFGGSCQGFRCICSPIPFLPGAPPPMGSAGSRMSEEPREVPCMTGNQRCNQFCVEHTGYGGQCHGQACKCAAFNRR
ncbi:uncharacterized protein LOC144105070 isoform X2 [Amblyomma americanum]